MLRHCLLVGFCLIMGLGAGAARGEEITVMLPGDVPLTLVYIPPGRFMMGSPEDERGRDLDEDLHWVTLTKGYYLGKYEVTQGQWEALMGTNPAVDGGCGSWGIGPENPVYCVSWNDVNTAGGFIDQLDAYLIETGQPGAGLFRLPTEAEWERAARAGTQTRFSHGDVLSCSDGCGWCDIHDQYMWWCGNTGESQPVGWKDANDFGLYDIHGNIGEWVHDWYAYHLGHEPQADPTGPPTGSERAGHGGFFTGVARFSRSADRGALSPGGHAYFLGLRLARSADDRVFGDDFESGDTSAWSATVP